MVLTSCDEAPVEASSKPIVGRKYVYATMLLARQFNEMTWNELTSLDMFFKLSQSGTYYIIASSIHCYNCVSSLETVLGESRLLLWREGGLSGCRTVEKSTRLEATQLFPCVLSSFLPGSVTKYVDHCSPC